MKEADDDDGCMTTSKAWKSDHIAKTPPRPAELLIRKHTHTILAAGADDDDGQRRSKIKEKEREPPHPKCKKKDSWRDNTGLFS